MKIRIDIDESISEEEVIIRCRTLSDEVAQLQRMLAQTVTRGQKLAFYRGDTEFYLSPDSILFFETDENGIAAHTGEHTYRTDYKLYELEKLLPPNFMRISKSAILNVNRIYSISRNIGTAAMVQFHGTHKQVYVSRMYYKVLKERIEEKRLSL